MHWLDSTILAVLAAAAVVGAYSGLLMQVFRLVGLAVALYAAACLHGNTTTWLHDSLLRGADDRACDAVAYGTVFLIVYLTIFLLTLVLERGVKAAQLQYLNRGLGALLAMAKMSLLIGAVCYGLQQLQHEPTMQVMEESTVVPLLARSVEQGIAAVPQDLKNEWFASWNHMRESLPLQQQKTRPNADGPLWNPKLGP